MIKEEDIMDNFFMKLQT